MEYCSVYATPEDIAASKLIIKTCMEDANIHLTDKELDLLTQDIMDTSTMMGGNFEENNIRDICQDYIDSNFYPRFVKLHRKELGGAFFRF